MSGLSNLAEINSSVTIRGNEIDVYPMRLIDLANLIAKHKGLLKAFDGENDVVSVITSCGQHAVNDFIAAATREKIKTVEKANLTGVEEAQILLEAVELTLPSDDEEMSSFLVNLANLMNRFKGHGSMQLSS